MTYYRCTNHDPNSEKFPLSLNLTFLGDFFHVEKFGVFKVFFSQYKGKFPLEKLDHLGKSISHTGECLTLINDDVTSISEEVHVGLLAVV